MMVLMNTNRTAAQRAVTTQPALAIMSRAAIVAGFVLSAAMPAIAQQPTAIGVTAEIENLVTGTVNGINRPVGKDDPVYLDERLSSQADATGQFILHDDTRLALAPNSELTLDRFIYDPARSGGEVVISAVRGAFRFISGKAGKSAYKIKTPTATIGVRGTTFDWYVDENGEAAVGLVDGGVDVCGSDGQCQAINRPGYFIHVAPNGRIGRPSPWNERFLRRARFARAFPFLLRRDRLSRRFRGPQIRIRGLTPQLRRRNLRLRIRRPIRQLRRGTIRRPLVRPRSHRRLRRR